MADILPLRALVTGATSGIGRADPGYSVGGTAGAKG
jgi:hypothetical protein